MRSNYSSGIEICLPDPDNALTRPTRPWHLICMIPAHDRDRIHRRARRKSFRSGTRFRPFPTVCAGAAERQRRGRPHGRIPESRLGAPKLPFQLAGATCGDDPEGRLEHGGRPEWGKRRGVVGGVSAGVTQSKKHRVAPFEFCRKRDSRCAKAAEFDPNCRVSCETRRSASSCG